MRTLAKSRRMQLLRVVWYTLYVFRTSLFSLFYYFQRYYVNDEFIGKEKRNVAFLMIGGEGEATDVWMTNGAWVEYGKQFNAILFQVSFFTSYVKA